MSTCPRCGEKNAERARFCSTCGEKMTPQGARDEVRKTVTVVFCDVADSTRLGERLDPEAHRRVMGRYFEAMREVLERHGGAVEKFIGDAVMAVFGVPVLHEDDALRAVRAAADMRETLTELNREFRGTWDLEIAIRTGVNTGEVVTGDPGTAQTLVTGDAVVVAKRLEETAAPSEIQLGAGTYRLVRDAVLAEPVGPLEAKGKPAMSAWRLLAVRSDAEVTHVRLDSPLVGRELDLAALQEMFERVVGEGSCRLFTVLGPAGIGKSRLVHELIAWIGDRALVLRGRCLPYGEGITYWPLVEVVKQAAGFTDRDSPNEARERIGKLIRSDESDLVCQRLASAVGRGEPAAARPEETFWAVRRLFEALAEDRPLVVVFDDIQWAESTFLDLIEYVAGWSTSAPVLLCCLARPELLERRSTWALPRPNALVTLLDPLPDADTTELIDNLLGGLPFPIEAQKRVGAAAQGNPLFVEELVRMLIDEGLLRRENGGWSATADLGELSVPPSIHALLSARLDRLEPEERGVIQRGSVAGQVFWWGAVAELSPESVRDQVGSHLQSLVRRELIRQEPSAFAAEDAFRFGHILIRDAAYSSLPKEARAELHEALARWLEAKTPDRAEYEEILGYHLEQAFRYRSQLAPTDETARVLAARAAEYLAPAGGRALRRGDVPAAVNLLRRARALLTNGSETRTQVLLDLGTALRETGELAQAEAALAEAIEIARQRGHAALAERARLERAAIRAYLGHDVDEVLDIAAESIAAFEQAGDDLGCAIAWRQVAESVHWSRCHLGAMEEALERALVYAERSGDDREVAAILEGLCRLAFAGPTPVEEGIRRCRDTLSREDPTLKAVAELLLGALTAMQGRFDDARRSMARAGRAFEELGLSLKLAGSAMYAGYVELFAGEFAAAERELRRGYGALDRMGERAQLATFAGLLARALVEQSRIDEAEQYVAVSEEAATEDDVLSHVIWRTAKAKALAQQGELEEAERLAREAVAIAEPSDALFVQGDAAYDHADVLIMWGRPRKAAPVLERAVRLHEAKGNVVGASRARSALAQLDFHGAKR